MVPQPERGCGNRPQHQRHLWAARERSLEFSPQQHSQSAEAVQIGLDGSAWNTVGSSSSNDAEDKRKEGTPSLGPHSVSDRVVAAATAAAAAAAAVAAARAEAAAETARRYLQPWVVVEEYSKWRQLDREEQLAWATRGHRIFREHLLPYVPSDVSPAIAAAEADAGGSSGSSSTSRAPPVSLSTPTSTNRLAALFGVVSPSSTNTAALTRHPWNSSQVNEQLREEIWLGVPDHMKCCVWIHANDALLQQKLHPSLYTQVQEQAFGPPPFPESLPGRCPTFSGGLLGLEEDVHGLPTTLKHLELDGETPLATWRSAPDETQQPHDSRGRERHHWGMRLRLPHNQPQGSSPCSRKLSPLAAYSRSPDRNPLGQTVSPEFNFWPERPTFQGLEERQRQLNQLNLPSNNPKHKDRKGSGGGVLVDELLSYIGINRQPNTPGQHGARRLRAPDSMGPLLEAASKWESGTHDEKEEASGAPVQTSKEFTPVSCGPQGTLDEFKASSSRHSEFGRCPNCGVSGGCHRCSDSPGSSSRRFHSATGVERTVSRGDSNVSLCLFGRAHADDLALFSSYMKDRHLQAKRQAEQMREATERSRDRVAFEAAAAAVMAAAKAVDNEQDELTFRRHYTSTSLDLTQKGLWGQRKPGRGASESQLIKLGPPKGGTPLTSLETQQGPTKSFVAFLRRKKGKGSQHSPQSPLKFSQPQQRLMEQGSLTNSEQTPGAPLSFPACPSEGSPASGSPAVWVTASESPRSGGARELVPAGGRRALSPMASETKDSKSVVGWLQRAARSSSEVCVGTVLGRRRGASETQTGAIVPFEGAPNLPRKPVRKKSLLNRLLPHAVLCRTPKGRRRAQEQQRLDFLSNAMRAGGDPFETNRLAAAAASAAVRDIRRHSSSSTFSDEALHSAKGAAAAAAVAVAADFPPFNGGGLHALPEHEGDEGYFQGRELSRQQQELLEQHRLPPMHENQWETKALCAAPSALLQETEGSPAGPQGEETPMRLNEGASTPPGPQENPAVLLLPPLPPNSVDYYEQQQQLGAGFEPTDNASRAQAKKSWKEQIEEGAGTDVYQLEGVTDFTRLLNTQGRAAARRLLWSLFTFFRNGLEFCPLIPHLACILLLYMSEPAAYAVLYCLVKKAQDKAAGNRLGNIVVKRKDFVWLVNSVVEAIRFKFPRLFLHMRHLGVDVAAWTARGLQDGFSRLLPFDFVLRIMGVVLFEGSLALCRFSLALVQLLEPELMACDTDEEAERVLYRCSSDPCLSINLLASTAMNMKTNMSRILGEGATGLQSPYLMSTKIHEFITVRPTDSSRFMSLAMWETVWRWLPEILRYCSPTRLFSTSHDGITLTALLSHTEAKRNLPMIFLLCTQADEIMGFFSPFPISSWKPCATASLDGAFVFRLRPSETAFWWTGHNDVFLQVRKDGIYVGTNDVALWLDRNLDRGRSSASASFGSEQLVGDEWGDFRAIDVEVWGVQ